MDQELVAQLAAQLAPQVADQLVAQLAPQMAALLIKALCPEPELACSNFCKSMLGTQHQCKPAYSVRCKWLIFSPLILFALLVLLTAAMPGKVALGFRSGTYLTAAVAKKKELLVAAYEKLKLLYAQQLLLPCDATPAAIEARRKEMAALQKSIRAGMTLRLKKTSLSLSQPA